MKNLVIIDNNQPITTSLRIAEIFEKEHYRIISAIENMEMPKDFTAMNFQASEYIDSRGRKHPMYNITRDGFALLAMSFTEKKALQWKIKYIRAFNQMDAALKKDLTIPQVDEKSALSEKNKAVIEFMATQVDMNTAKLTEKDDKKEIPSTEEIAVAEAIVALKEKAYTKGKIDGMLCAFDKMDNAQITKLR